MDEGEQITYVGFEADGLMPGDRGTLLVFGSSTSAHIQVTSGQVRGQVHLVSVDDLAGVQHTAKSDLLEDSLEVGGLSTFAVRDVYEEQGESGVLNAMAQLGHLTGFSEIAEEAIVMVSSRIRHDPSFREVLGRLDEEAGESVLRLAAACLIRDAFAEA